MLHSTSGGKVSAQARYREVERQKTHPRKGISVSAADGLIFDYLEALGSPRALTVWLLYSSDEHRQLVELTSDPSNYVNAYQFRLDHAATKFLSKCVGLRTGIDLKEVALGSARDAEVQCSKTNLRIKEWRQSTHVSGAPHAEFFSARKLIASILGKLPGSFHEVMDLQVRSFVDNCYEFGRRQVTGFDDVGWSTGRTTSASGAEVASLYKYASRLDVTVKAREHAFMLVRNSPLWSAAALQADSHCSVTREGFNIVEGNVLITVPKSAKTDRVICYEPHMNIRLQLAVGNHIRRRLLKWGVDLNDQSVNQRRARAAAIDGSLATIDLSQASDTVSLELVRELLPVDWAIRLESLRSGNTLWPDGIQRVNEKFSSMGNGFTFELESLIFYALASARSTNVSVYGDDIIIPNDDFDRVSDLLEASGFTINKRKSYATTMFRESCGVDCFGSVDCTAVYLRRLPKTKEDVLKLHNAVRAWCDRDSFPGLCWSRLLRRWRNIHTGLLGPQGTGDGHYHVNFDEATPSRAKFQIEGWLYSTWLAILRVNTLYGDRVCGSFPARFGFAALSAATGPTRPRSQVDETVDRRLYALKQHRTSISFWYSIVWE